MNCLYCHNEITIPNNFIGGCKDCNIKYFLYSTDRNNIAFVDIILDNYFIFLHFKDNNTCIYKYNHKYSYSRDYICIKKFDSILDITPKNAKEKLKTIITFL